MDNQKKIIFISGTGRSGTHLVGRSISSHPEITARIEESDTFALITRIATTQDIDLVLKTYLLKILLKLRLTKIFNNASNHVLEKSHPSLWLVDFLVKTFSASKFIFVYRDLEPTVNSMLEHQGVMTWYNRLPQNRKNRFLGVNKSNVDEFEKYSIEEKCALRWKSHYDEIFRLKKKYPQKVLVLKYDHFLTNPNQILKEVSDFLKISNSFTIETFKIESLDKWKNKLSPNQLDRIRKIVK